MFLCLLTGNRRLGGIEMDLAIKRFLIPRIMATTGVNLDAEAETSNRNLKVLHECKKVKEALSVTPTVSIV